MDAETRHQLKQNELGEALKKLNDPWVGYSLVAVILLFAAWFGYKYLEEQRQLAVANAWRTVLEANPEDPTNGAASLSLLQSVADDGPNPAVEHAALLKIGVAKRTEGRKGKPDVLREALNAFTTLANDSGADSGFRSAAMYGAALTHEDLREISEAKAMYERLRDEAALAGTPYQELAGERLTTLEELGEPVQFTAGLPPVNLDEVLGPTTPQAVNPVDLAELVGSTSQPAATETEEGEAAEEGGTEEPESGEDSTEEAPAEDPGDGAPTEDEPSEQP